MYIIFQLVLFVLRCLTTLFLQSRFGKLVVGSFVGFIGVIKGPWLLLEGGKIFSAIFSFATGAKEQKTLLSQASSLKKDGCLIAESDVLDHNISVNSLKVDERLDSFTNIVFSSVKEHNTALEEVQALQASCQSSSALAIKMGVFIFIIVLALVFFKIFGSSDSGPTLEVLPAINSSSSAQVSSSTDSLLASLPSASPEEVRSSCERIVNFATNAAISEGAYQSLSQQALAQQSFDLLSLVVSNGVTTLVAADLLTLIFSAGVSEGLLRSWIAEGRSFASREDAENLIRSSAGLAGGNNSGEALVVTSLLSLNPFMRFLLARVPISSNVERLEDAESSVVSGVSSVPAAFIAGIRRLANISTILFSSEGNDALANERANAFYHSLVRVRDALNSFLESDGSLTSLTALRASLAVLIPSIMEALEVVSGVQFFNYLPPVQERLLFVGNFLTFGVLQASFFGPLRSRLVRRVREVTPQELQLESVNADVRTGLLASSRVEELDDSGDIDIEASNSASLFEELQGELEEGFEPDYSFEVHGDSFNPFL